MAFIDTISESEAAASILKLYETDRADLGYVANCTNIFAHRPGVYESVARDALSVGRPMAAS